MDVYSSSKKLCFFHLRRLSWVDYFMQKEFAAPKIWRKTFMWAQFPMVEWILVSHFWQSVHHQHQLMETHLQKRAIKCEVPQPCSAGRYFRLNLAKNLVGITQIDDWDFWRQKRLRPFQYCYFLRYQIFDIVICYDMRLFEKLLQMNSRKIYVVWSNSQCSPFSLYFGIEIKLPSLNPNSMFPMLTHPHLTYMSSTLLHSSILIKRVLSLSKIRSNRSNWHFHNRNHPNQMSTVSDCLKYPDEMKNKRTKLDKHF